MPRRNFITFILLTVILQFVLMYLMGGKKTMVQYAAYYFFAPTIALMLLSALISVIRFYMSEDPERLTIAGSFFHASWLSVAFIFGGIALFEHLQLLK